MVLTLLYRVCLRGPAEENEELAELLLQELGARQGERDRGFGGLAWTPRLGLFLRKSIPFIWRILSAFLPA
jgi:hypothetical protein